MTSTPLTSDQYSIDINNDDHICDEFPVLRADTTQTQASSKPEQSEAQKEVVRLLRLKFKYPSQDPPPNKFQDTRTEREKVESILRISSQILDAENLDVWNRVCERSLHLVRQHNSGIPLLCQNIMDQIKSFRLQKQQEEELLLQTEALTNLKVNCKSDPSDKEQTASATADRHLTLLDPEACDAPTTPATDIDCLNSITMRSPLPSSNLSTIFYDLLNGSPYT